MNATMQFIEDPTSSNGRHTGRFRFVMLKGFAGLGNRLLSLSACLTYAQETGRTVVVDWRDGMYAPRGVDAFKQIFMLSGAADLQSLEGIPISLIHPSSWSIGALHEPVDSLYELKTSPLPRIPTWLLPRGRMKMLNRFWGFRKTLSSSVRSGLFTFLRDALRRNNFHLGRDLSRSLSSTVVIFADFSSDHSPAQLKTHLGLTTEMQSIVDQTSRQYYLWHNGGRRIGLHVRSTDRIPKKDVTRLIAILLQRTERRDTFYLATDNPCVDQIFRKALPNRIFPRNIFYPANFLQGLHRAPASPDNKARILKEAVTDIWMLSQVDVLYFQGSSSFSDVAAALLPASSISYDWEKQVAHA